MRPWRRSKQNIPPQGDGELSPLDCIRQAEAETTRRILAAHEAAEQIQAQARLDTECLLEQAHQAGKQEGQANYEEILNKTELEAKEIVSQAQRQVDQLLIAGEERMDAAVRLVLELLLH
jgi:vacuolar-type H+-ATPase subunit H